MAKLKIVSDGTSLGTKVTDENGNNIDNITSINWFIDSNNVSHAIIQLTYIEAELEGEQK